MITPELKIARGIPVGLLDAKPSELRSLLGNPTLLFLGSSSLPPIFVSLLLHGNETSGFTILKKLLKEYDLHSSHRPLIVFIGNVFAAEKNLRKLDTTSDYNRIWRDGNFPENALATEVLKILRKEKPFASIDLHNNTGRNPVYGCIREVNEATMTLASLFSNTAVHTQRPEETLTHVMSELCPAITCECGLPDSQEGIQKGLDFVRDCLHLDRLPDEHIRKKDLNVYHSLGRIHLPVGTSVSFQESPGETHFTFSRNYDLQNFTELRAGSVFGWRKDSVRLKLLDEQGRDIADQYFIYQGNEIRIKTHFTPAMLTTIIPIIFQDCLGYAMQPIEKKA